MSIAVIYVNLDNDYRPSLSATTSADYTPNVTVYDIMGHSRQVPIVYGSISATIGPYNEMVYFPPWTDSYTNGTTVDSALNWHQFLGHLRQNRYAFTGAKDEVTDVVYKIFGSRTTTDEYDGLIGNSSFGFDIFVGFEPSIDVSKQPRYGFTYPRYSFSYSAHIYFDETGNERTISTDLELRSITFTNLHGEPYRLNIAHINGNSARFVLGTPTTFYVTNGMIQTSEGADLSENSDIVFERFFLGGGYKWKSVNDLYYGYDYPTNNDPIHPLSYYSDDITNATDMATYITKYKPMYLNDYSYTRTRYKVATYLNNMWISSSGFIGFYLNDYVGVYNTTLRADWHLQTFKSKNSVIEVVNSFVVVRDNAFEDINTITNDAANNITDELKHIKPFKFNTCTVCWPNLLVADKELAFVSQDINVQYDYKRGVFVNATQSDFGAPASPPSIMTSAVGEIELSALNYLNDDFIGVTVLGDDMDNRAKSLIRAWTSIGKWSPPNFIYKSTNNVSSILPEYGGYNIDVMNMLDNVWLNVTDSGEIGTKIIVRDGIGALYFPTYHDKAYKYTTDPTNIRNVEFEIGDSATFTIVDDQETDFWDTYLPSNVNWTLISTPTNTFISEDDSTATHSTVFNDAGCYDVWSGVYSHFGFYGYKLVTRELITVTSDTDFDFVLVNMTDDTTPDTFYAGRQYRMKFTNTSVDSGPTIKSLYVKYGENGDIGSAGVYSETTAINSNLPFASTGGTYYKTISFDEPYGFSTVTAIATTISLHNIIKTKRVFVDVKEDVYFVDLSLEYEVSGSWVNMNTLFQDDFENGLKVGWSSIFNASTESKLMWSEDMVAVSKTGVDTVKLFDTRIGNDCELEFSFVRTAKTDKSVFELTDGTKSFKISWDYINEMFVINGAAYRYTFPKSLDCSNSLRSIHFKVMSTGSVITVEYKYNGDGEWLPASTSNFTFTSTLQLNVTYSTTVGIGYFKGQSSYGFSITNGTTEDYPFTYQQFRARINTTAIPPALKYDIYKCRGYREVLSEVKAVEKVTIDAWDLSKYGPWVMSFKLQQSPYNTHSFTNALLKNGVIYLVNDNHGILFIGNAYDMFISWKSSAAGNVKFRQIIQSDTNWKNSKYQTSKLIGCTINIESV
jgi:hypothetical protein